MADEMTRRESPNSVTPGDGLLELPVLLAIGLLLANDHVLKAVAPGFVTGKLSDFAGLLYFPLLVVAAAEVAFAAMGRWAGPSRWALALATLGTGITFTWMKLTVPGSVISGELFGFVQSAALAAVGQTQVGLTPRVAVDRTDLIALSSLLAAWLIGSRRVGRSRPFRGRRA